MAYDVHEIPRVGISLACENPTSPSALIPDWLHHPPLIPHNVEILMARSRVGTVVRSGIVCPKRFHSLVRFLKISSRCRTHAVSEKHSNKGAGEPCEREDLPANIRGEP